MRLSYFISYIAGLPGDTDATCKILQLSSGLILFSNSHIVELEVKSSYKRLLALLVK
jgi:hypothetical protein